MNATNPAEADDRLQQQLINQYAEFVQLVGGLAHEIRNPLSTIRLNMELLAEDFHNAKTPAERRAANKIAVVQRESIRLQELLDDFLNFARVRNLNLIPKDINSLVAVALDLFEPQAASSGLDVQRYLDADLARVSIDPETFQAALLNLIINAQQAMPEGGQLVVRTRATPTGVALDLIDTGCGMDAATINRAFDPFFSSKPGGSGLGLPTTRKIIEAHGGSLSVQSEPGQGTQFTIELPTPPRLTAE
ncbi:MAG: ATP-binding protein [Pirellulales bacterium]